MSNHLLVGLLKHARFPEGVAGEIYANHAEQYPWALMQNPTFAGRLDELLVCKPGPEHLRGMIFTRTRESLDAALDSRASDNDVLGTIVTVWKLGPKDQMRFVQRKLSVAMMCWVRYRSEFTPEAKAYIVANLEKGQRRNLSEQWCTSVSKGESELRLASSREWSREREAQVLQSTIDNLSSWAHGVSVATIAGARLGCGDEAAVNAWRNFMFFVENTPHATLETALEAAEVLAHA
jgi:hypothetical protein